MNPTSADALSTPSISPVPPPSPCNDTESPPPSPFANLKIDSPEPLTRINGRFSCPECQRSVKYFCYSCFQVVGCDRSELPTVHLPVPLDVIKHEGELDGKSTAVHARILAPLDVRIIPYKEVPEYPNPQEILLLYPGENAERLQNISHGSFKRFVVIDGTWSQAKRMVRDSPQLAQCRWVTIAPHKTLFWRFQNMTEYHLATIEAIYYLYQEYASAYECPRIHLNANASQSLSSSTTSSASENHRDIASKLPEQYDGRYDNLLYYYRFLYDFIQEKYRREARPFNTRHREGYIQQ